MTKREAKQNIVETMIALYCRKVHGNKKGALCEECAALSVYCLQKTQKCPFGDTDNFCSFCKIHCYCPQMREKIKKVMRFSGPRLLFIHPIMVIRHMLLGLRQQKKQKKQKKQKRSQ